MQHGKTWATSESTRGIFLCHMPLYTWHNLSPHMAKLWTTSQSTRGIIPGHIPAHMWQSSGPHSTPCGKNATSWPINRKDHNYILLHVWQKLVPHWSTQIRWLCASYVSMYHILMTAHHTQTCKHNKYLSQQTMLTGHWWTWMVDTYKHHAWQPTRTSCWQHSEPNPTSRWCKNGWSGNVAPSYLGWSLTSQVHTIPELNWSYLSLHKFTQSQN